MPTRAWTFFWLSCAVPMITVITTDGNDDDDDEDGLQNETCRWL